MDSLPPQEPRGRLLSIFDGLAEFVYIIEIRFGPNQEYTGEEALP